MWSYFCVLDAHALSEPLKTSSGAVLRFSQYAVVDRLSRYTPQLHCPGQQKKPVVLVNCLGSICQVVLPRNSVPVGTDSTKPEEGGKRAQKRRRTDVSADPPTGSRNATTPEEGIKSAKVRQRRGVSEDPPVRVHVSRGGEDSNPPSADVNMPPKPPAFTGFHHGHPIQNEESLVGSLVTGRVESKIDCGYSVSIIISGYTFEGNCSDYSTW